MKKIFLVIVLALMSIAVVAAFNILDLTRDGTVIHQISDRVLKLNDCNTVYWQEEEKTYGICSDIHIYNICEDEPFNTTCSQILEPFNYSCVRDTKVVEKSRQDCTAKGYIVDEITRLYTQEYECVISEEDGKVVVICDSRIDGNGDGKCTSGETCMKFVIDGDKVTQYERNSRDDFIESDESFFLDRVPVEVLK
jgi:hypothetical protein